MFNSDWYLSLTKPILSPLNWVFTPIWTILYFLIFISLIIYINSYALNKKIGYIFFCLQMFLNIIWAPVFFGLKNIKGGLIVIILLDIFVFLMIYKFFKASILSGAILIPYFLWILFATYLNIGYLLLNQPLYDNFILLYNDIMRM